MLQEEQYPKYLTLLFREAEEREVADGGIRLRDVLKLQDSLASIGVKKYRRLAQRFGTALIVC